MCESNLGAELGMFCFGVAAAFTSLLVFVRLPMWWSNRKHRKHVARGRSYWDAILEEDRRKRKIGESYEL